MRAIGGRIPPRFVRAIGGRIPPRFVRACGGVVAAPLPGGRSPPRFVTAVSFYHLERQGPDVALPRLLAKARERGWRSIVKVADPERLAALDVALWTFADESFLPHGRAADPHPEDQPILLTQDDANPNGAAALFVVDGAAVPDAIDAFERVAILLDGTDDAALAEGRRVFKALRQAGHALDYWRQNETGAWYKAA